MSLKFRVLRFKSRNTLSQKHNVGIFFTRAGICLFLLYTSVGVGTGFQANYECLPSISDTDVSIIDVSMVVSVDCILLHNCVMNYYLSSLMADGPYSSVKMMLSSLSIEAF